MKIYTSYVKIFSEEMLLFFLLATLTVQISAFYNPIKNPGQDPSVHFHNGNYYMVQTSNDNGIDVIRSQTLENIGSGVFTHVWSAPAGTEQCCEVWAPELVHWDVKWYIYYAADNGQNSEHRTYVLESEGDNPEGPYHSLGKITPATDRWAIDATVLELNGDRYLVWSGWPEYVDEHQTIYIARMSSPSTLSSDRFAISEPTNAWEIAPVNHGVNEGPAALYKDGRTYIVYSANGSWTDDYCLGLLTYLGGDPLSRNSWQKSNGCVFSKNPSNSVYGPGHNSFTQSPNGQEIWNVYHANAVSGSGWGGRSVRAQPVNWNSDGTPNFGAPVGFDDWVNPPAV